MSLSRPLKSLKIRLFSTFQFLENYCRIRKKTLTVWKFQTIKVILYSKLLFMFSHDFFISLAETFALKLDKSLCPVIFKLLELGVSLVVINCICLSFMQIHTDFYFDYIIYSGLLIFCCQNVATPLL